MCQWILIGLVCASMSGCAVVAVADAVVATGATLVKAGVKTVGAAVDAVLPDKKSDSQDQTGKR